MVFNCWKSEFILQNFSRELLVDIGIISINVILQKMSIGTTNTLRSILKKVSYIYAFAYPKLINLAGKTNFSSVFEYGAVLSLRYGHNVDLSKSSCLFSV